MTNNPLTFHESEASNPNAAPSMGAIAAYLEEKFPHVWNPYSRTAVVGAGATDGTTTMAFSGQCPSGDTANYAYAFGFGTSELTDSYGFAIPGGPKDPQIDNTTDHPVYTQALSRGNYFNTFFRVDGKRKLPWQTDSTAGYGITIDDYGGYDAQDPQNPGTTVTAPGAKDPTVTKPRFNIFPRASDTLPTVGEGAQTTDTEPGYDHPVYGTSAIGFDPTTKAAYVKWNPTDLKLDDQGRLDLSDTVKAELGGGGSGGPGAANYGINVGDNVDHLGNYIPWDHIITGADVYLNPTNTDGLTIPADGGGDYELTTTVAIDAHSGPTISNWSVEYWLTIELWRSGTQVLYLEKQDMYQDAPTDEQFWGHFKVDITAAVPGTQPGDVIKTHLATATSGFAGDPDGAIQVEADDVHTWVSIIPVGHGSATTIPTIQFDNTSGAATPDFGVDDIMHWDDPTVDPQLDTSGGTIAALDPVNDTLIDILQDGTYHIQGQLEGFLSGGGSSGNWQLEIDLYVNGALYGSGSAVPNAVCLPVTPTYLSGAQEATFPFSFDVQLKSGDTLSMPLSGPMPTGWSGNVGSSFTWLTISKVG